MDNNINTKTMRISEENLESVLNSKLFSKEFKLNIGNAILRNEGYNTICEDIYIKPGKLLNIKHSGGFVSFGTYIAVEDLNKAGYKFKFSFEQNKGE